jgi:hypothetical protein
MTSPPDSNKTTLKAALLGVIVLAICGLIANQFASRQPVDAAEAEALQEQSALNIELMQDEISDRLTGASGSEEQARLDTPLGQALFRKCLEWTEFHENHPSESTAANRQRACEEYQGYVIEGIEPELDDGR